MTDNSKQPKAVGNPKQHNKPMPDHKQGEGVAQNKPAQQPKPKTTSTTAAHANNRASHGNESGSKHKQERTNEQTMQPKPQPNSTTAAQVKDPKATACVRETNQEASKNNNDMGSKGGAASCNPGSCKAIAEEPGQRPPVGAPHHPTTCVPKSEGKQGCSTRALGAKKKLRAQAPLAPNGP